MKYPISYLLGIYVCPIFLGHVALPNYEANIGYQNVPNVSLLLGMNVHPIIELLGIHVVPNFWANKHTRIPIR